VSRGLLYGLIAAAALANVAVYLWQDAAPGPAVPLPKDRLPELVLLSELEDEPALLQKLEAIERDAEAYATADPESSERPPAVVAGDAKDDSRVGGMGEYSGGEPGDQAVLAASAGAARTSAGPPVDATASAAEPTADLGERADAGATAERVSGRCWLAGPVVGERLAVELAASFDAAGLTMDLVLETVEAEPDYWVYLPTSGAPADIRRLSRELGEAGIESFPINKGTLAGSLSIGLFRSSERAGSMQNRLREQGYQAEIYTRSRIRDEAWIALDDAGRTALEWPDREGPLPGYVGMMLRERPCPQARN
jgi:hypothetical protein